MSIPGDQGDGGAAPVESTRNVGARVGISKAVVAELYGTNSEWRTAQLAMQPPGGVDVTNFAITDDRQKPVGRDESRPSLGPASNFSDVRDAAYKQPISSDLVRGTGALPEAAKRSDAGQNARPDHGHEHGAGALPERTRPGQLPPGRPEGEAAPTQRPPGRNFEHEEDGSSTYKVQKGDSLWRIMREAMTAPGKVPSGKEIDEAIKRVARENRLADPNKIKPDQMLRIPGDLIRRPEPERPPEKTHLKVENSGASPEFEAKVRGITDQLPEGVKRALNAAGISVGVGRTVGDVAPELRTEQPRGWPSGTTWENTEGMFDPSRKQIILSEMRRDRQGELIPTQRSEGVIRHETGHALDAALGDYSASPEFKAAYERDVAKMTPAQRDQLSYLLQPGNAGRSETFAEVFAGIHGGTTNDRETRQTMDAFPETAALMRRKLASL